ncbi:hypothetical protein BV133_2558 [Blastochloris viridis]|uniref:Uncharacterized protein n=1 Tax=Blastochloris viridis TaxID=1079 RepID=A0A182D5H0_BLAVI|nr:hypothetical protein BV133_2558 [Blastochloris viridis]
MVLGGLAAGCANLGEGELHGPGGPAVPPPFPQDMLIGNWGIASYRQEKDRKRTEVQARAQCKLPYTITKGPTDGIMMHVADDPQLHELKLKGAPGGKAFIGFEGPPGDPQDREVLSFSDGVITMRFVDPDAFARYGIFVFVRCSG